MNRYGKILAAAGATCLMTAVGFADSISPSSFSATLAVGGSTTIHKTVTVSAGKPTSSKVDVFFLADSTGSMGGEIAAVKSAATSIMTSIAAGDVAFGVGDYKDNFDAYVYKKGSDITTNVATAQTAINGWFASGGGDLPEANLYALKQVADTTTWRAGSERLVVWFGDAVGHDPGGPTAVTKAQAIAALNAKGIAVLAVNVGNMNAGGQAADVATGTGGTLYNGINEASIVATINAAIDTAITTYSNVGLDLSEAPAGVSVTAVPLDYSGSFDRSIERTFEFDVTFTGVSPGTYDFTIYGTVDGGRVAGEKDHIVVGDGRHVPDTGSSIMLLGLGLTLIGLIRRKLS